VAGSKVGKLLLARTISLKQMRYIAFSHLTFIIGDTIGRWNLSLGGVLMLDYKEIIFRYYGGGMSGLRDGS